MQTSTTTTTGPTGTWTDYGVSDAERAAWARAEDMISRTFIGEYAYCVEQGRTFKVAAVAECRPSSDPRYGAVVVGTLVTRSHTFYGATAYAGRLGAEVVR